MFAILPDMRGGVKIIRKPAIIFNHIDLSRGDAFIRPDEPESWPGAHAIRQLRGHFKIAVLLGETGFRVVIRPGGADEARAPFAIRPLARGDFQPLWAGGKNCRIGVGKNGIAEIPMPGRVGDPARASPLCLQAQRGKIIRKCFMKSREVQLRLRVALRGFGNEHAAEQSRGKTRQREPQPEMTAAAAGNGFLSHGVWAAMRRAASREWRRG